MTNQPAPAELRTDARANHERIVRAATDAFAERGLGVEMREIAESAGVAVGTIYRHFPSKEDLLIAIARSMLQEAAAGIDQCNAMPDPIEGLRALIAGNLTGVARFGWLAGVLHSGQIPRHCLEQLKADMEASGLRDRFQPLIRRAIAGGALRPDLDVAIASAMLEGTTVPWTSGAIRGGRGTEQAASEIMRLFLAGAGAADTDAPSHSRRGSNRLK